MLTEEVISHIKNALAQGQSKEAIYQELLGQGLTLGEIQEGFEATNVDEVEDKQKVRQKTIWALVSVGVILICMGVVLFVRSYWENLARAWQVLILIIPMLAAEIVGWWLKERKHLITTGEALIWLGLFLYGVNLFVIPLLFTENVVCLSDKLSLWVLGSIFMAFASESLSIFYLVIILSLVLTLGGVTASQSILSLFLLLSVVVVVFLTGLHFYRKSSLISQ